MKYLAGFSKSASPCPLLAMHVCVRVRVPSKIVTDMPVKNRVRLKRERERRRRERAHDGQIKACLCLREKRASAEDERSGEEEEEEEAAGDEGSAMKGPLC